MIRHNFDQQDFVVLRWGFCEYSRKNDTRTKWNVSLIYLISYVRDDNKWATGCAKSPVLPLRDLRPMCDGRPPEPKGDHSTVSQKGSNYFLRIDPNTRKELLILWVFTFSADHWVK